jgi:hypothetical protein|uniref:Uncharacterized protein n=1 Tax=viral metagenome TaxID=1070528 RepID=A0A6M3XSU2_9ZZZZ
MAITNQTKRAVMTMAWGLFREAQEGEEPRTFADALSSAWAWIKGLAKAQARFWKRQGKRAASLTAPSAICSRYGSTAYVGGRRSVAYLTAVIGT